MWSRWSSRTAWAGIVARVLVLLTAIALPTSAWAQERAPASETLPAMIPLFPLGDIVLFPHVTRSLYIFEPRYRAMIADALEGDRIIGMIQLRPGYEADYEGRPPVYAVGCAGRIVEANQLPDGRYTIVLEGLQKFRVVGEDASRQYRLARVEALPEALTADDRASLGAQRERLSDLLAAMGINPPPPAVGDEDVVNTLAQFLDLAPATRQELLEVQGPLLRAHALVDLLERR